MTINNENGTINVGGKEYTIEQTCEKLAKLSSTQIAEFFKNREIKLPRALNMQALRAVLNDKVKQTKELNLSDEVRYRLLCYPDFSEYQLQNFMKMVVDYSLFDTYKKKIWEAVLLNNKQLKLQDSELNYLLMQKEQRDISDFAQYEETLFPSVYDAPNCFDGLTKDNFRKTLLKSSTLVELREIGVKYNLNIPRRLKKEELQQIISEELQAMGLLTDESKEKMNRMSVMTLQRFAKQNGIKASIELKKEELIEYILKQADKSNLTTNPNLGNFEQLSDNNSFEFKEEYVKTIEEIKAEQEAEETLVVEEAPAEEAPAEEKVEEAPTEEKVEETPAVSQPVVQTVVQAGIDKEELKEIIKETVTEIVTQLNETKAEEPKEEPKPTLTKEEIKDLVRECLEATKEETPKEVAPTLSPEQAKALVAETVEAVVTNLADKITPVTKIVQLNGPQQVVASTPVQVVSQMPSAQATALDEAKYANFDNQLEYQNVPDYENKNYDASIADEMNNADKSKISDNLGIKKTPTVVVEEKAEAKKTYPDFESMPKKEQKKYIKKMLKRVDLISKGKLLPTDEDLYFIETYQSAVSLANTTGNLEKSKSHFLRNLIITIVIILAIPGVLFLVDWFMYKAGTNVSPYHDFIKSLKNLGFFQWYWDCMKWVKDLFTGKLNK